MLLSPTPIANNGTLRCYNMFPSHFKNINEMTEYLSHVKKLGMNAVWINPVQLTGNFVIEKSDMLTAQMQALKGSLYAMADPNLLDPRFSMVKRDEEGDALFTKEQIAQLPNYDEQNINKIKRYRGEISDLKTQLGNKKRDLIRFSTPSKKGGTIDLKGIAAANLKIAELEQKLDSKLKHFNRQLQKQRSWLMSIDGKAMKAFTDRAKELGMTPMFDLVFNHLASDAPIVSDEANAQLFNFEDKTYPDATAFAYSKLLGSRRSGPLTPQEKSDALAQIPVIIQKIWRPFIHQYVNEWGFCGVRIDCVRKVPQELRLPVYELIRQGVARQKNPAPLVILEEALFSDLNTEEFIEKVKGANATHITGSAYYAAREWHGGLSGDYNKEDYLKRSIVKDGVINFTGNHDHFSCAMTVCRELAFERLQQNRQLFQAYNTFVKEKELANEGRALPASSMELIKTLFMHSYVKQILSELNNHDDYNDTINRFGKAYRDKIITNVYAGSGGYFMLAGDEFASLHQPTVFIRANGEKVYPDKKLAIFDSEFTDIAMEAIRQMARESVEGKKYNNLFSQLSPENQNLFLSSFMEQIYFEINAGIEKTQEKFSKVITRLAKEPVPPKLLSHEVATPLEYKNGWRAPASLKKFANPAFFNEMNDIMAKLPRSNHGFWSELFKSNNDDILIAVRINGQGYNAHTDVVIHNLNPDKTARLDKQTLEKIGMWLQKRGFSEPKTDLATYHQAYGCIMGQDNKQPPADLYFAGKIELDKDIEEHSVQMRGQPVKFNIVVKPKAITFDALWTPGPETVVQEEISPKQLLTMFSNLTTQDSSEQSSPRGFWTSDSGDDFDDEDEDNDLSSGSGSDSRAEVDEDLEQILMKSSSAYKGF